MIDFKDLGFTQEELQDRIVDQICGKYLSGIEFDEDGNEAFRDSDFANKLRIEIQKRIDSTINALAEKYVFPSVSTYIENICLQTTNEWGQKKGEPFTFVEYLVKRSEAYMQEKVDRQGQDKTEGGYNFSGTQTRITYLVNKHLHDSIETAMKQSLAAGLGEVAKGIHETARIKLNEIAASMKVNVTLK